MSILSPTSNFSVQPPTMPVHRFSVDEYHQMIQSGILTPDHQVELLEGLIVPKMARNPPHDGTCEIVEETLRRYLPPGWRIRSQKAITTSESEPEPDVTVVPGTVRSNVQRHPLPQEIALLTEVSDTSLSRDRNEKLRLYARARIECYWIINLIDRQVEVYTDPTGPDDNPVFRLQQIYRIGDAVPLVIAGQEVARVPVAELLP